MEQGKKDGFRYGFNGAAYPDLRGFSSDYKFGFAKGYEAGASL